MLSIAQSLATWADHPMGLQVRLPSHLQPMEREHACGEGQTREKKDRREAESDSPQADAVIEDLLES